jgi:hypothetical protein
MTMILFLVLLKILGFLDLFFGVGFFSNRWYVLEVGLFNQLASHFIFLFGNDFPKDEQ